MFFIRVLSNTGNNLEVYGVFFVKTCRKPISKVIFVPIDFEKWNWQAIQKFYNVKIASLCGSTSASQEVVIAAKM